MHFPNNDPQAHPAPEITKRSDETDDSQLELEIRAFAELWLDIYEGGYLPDQIKPNSPTAFDGPDEGHKMKERSNSNNQSLT